MPVRPWLVGAVLALLLAIGGALAGARSGFFEYTLPFASLICSVAAILLADSVWRWTGVGLAGWIVGDMMFFSVLNEASTVPSWPDFGYVMLYVGMFLSLYGWTRRSYRALSWRLALDGALVGATAGAVVAAIAFPKLIEGASSATLEASFALVYPVADTMLLMFVVLVLGRRGWQPERVLILFGCALVCFTITDVATAILALQNVDAGTVSIPSSALDLGRMIGAILLAVGASSPTGEPVYSPPSRWALIGIPSACALVSVTILSLGRVVTIPLSSWALATLTSVLVVGRLVTAYLERDEAYEERARQERLLRDLLADMSHELRTPLTNVLGQLEQLYRERATDVEARRISSALRSSQRMETLIGELLLLARAKSKNLLVGGSADLALVVKEAIDETELIGLGHPLTRRLRTAPVDGDRPALVRAVTNLLANAYRHTPPGTEVVVETWSDAAGAHVRVADSGEGIPEELRTRMWDRYVRGEHPESSGIGLALVRAIAIAHGGSVVLEARPGSSFLLSFPIKKGERAE